MRILTLALLLAVVYPPYSICYAKSIYLECTLKNHNSDKSWKEFVKVDEDSSKITHTSKKKSYNVAGVFSPNKIKYNYRTAYFSYDKSSMYTYVEIDRSTLNIVKHTVQKWKSAPITESLAKARRDLQSSVDKIKIDGACKIVDVKNRKI